MIAGCHCMVACSLVPSARAYKRSFSDTQRVREHLSSNARYDLYDNTIVLTGVEQNRPNSSNAR